MDQAKKQASIYPASLQGKANGYRYQAYCFICEDGTNTRSRKKAEEWAEAHNLTEGHGDIGRKMFL